MYYTCKQQNEHRYLAKPFLLKRQTGFRRFHAHSCTIMCSRCAGFPSEYATVLTVFYRSCQQMHRDVQLRSIRESVKYCLCALQLSGSNVQSAILAPLSRKFAGRAEIIKTGLRGCAFPLPSHKLVKASVDTLKHIPVYTRARTHTHTSVRDECHFKHLRYVFSPALHSKVACKCCIATYFGDQPRHLTRYSTLPCNSGGKKW